MRDVRVVGRRGRWMAVGLVALLLLATACGSTSKGTQGENGSVDTPVSEDVVRNASIASSIASGAYQAYSTISTCLANQAVGQPCLASDSSNIRAILAQLKELRAVIDANQQQMLDEFNAIRDMIRDQNVKSAAAALQPMVVNVELAGKAYVALAECAQSTTGTCRPFQGRDGDPQEDVKTAIPKTQGYFLEKANNLPADLPLTASWFTGTGPSYTNGLATAIWLFNKGRQDQVAGVTSTEIKNSDTVPVVTPGLAKSQNQDIKYWTDLYSQYAFLSVVNAGLSQGASIADRRQAEVDGRIADQNSRQSVVGSANYYSLPDLDTGAIVSDMGMTLRISPAPFSGSQPLDKTVLEWVPSTAAKYSSLEKLAQVDGVMPSDRWYTVMVPIERKTYPTLELVSTSGLGVTATVGTWSDLDVTWLALGSSSRETCPTRVRPVSTPPTRPSGAVEVTNLDKIKPAFEPEDRLTQVWNLAAQTPLEYTWDVRKQNDLQLGWGAWIVCTGGTPGGYQRLRDLPLVRSVR